MIKELWVEAYRPKTIEECILPADLTNRFSSYVREGNIPNLILNGPSGVGKTTVARAMLDEYDCDYLKINSALKKGIDVIRDEILEFASTISFKGKKKFVIFDEADGMLHGSQKALNAFIEQYSDNCGYIFITNNSKKLLPELQSRCQIVNFEIEKKDFPLLAKSFYTRLETIFRENKVEYNKQVVGPVLKRYFPDWRKMLITFQDYAIHNNGKIDVGILGEKQDESYSELLTYLKAKDWNEMRKWVGENAHVCVSFGAFASKLARELEKAVNPRSLSVAIVIINDYDFRDYFVSDKQLNIVAFLTKIISEVVWK